MSDVKAANRISIFKNSPLTRFFLGQQLVHHEVCVACVVLHAAYAYISKTLNVKLQYM